MCMHSAECYFGNPVVRLVQVVFRVSARRVSAPCKNRPTFACHMRLAPLPVVDLDNISGIRDHVNRYIVLCPSQNASRMRTLANCFQHHRMNCQAFRSSCTVRLSHVSCRWWTLTRQQITGYTSHRLEIWDVMRSGAICMMD